MFQVDPASGNNIQSYLRWEYCLKCALNIENGFSSVRKESFFLLGKGCI